MRNIEMKTAWFLVVALAASIAAAQEFSESTFECVEPDCLVFSLPDYESDMLLTDANGSEVRLRFNVEHRVIQVIAHDGWSIENVSEFTLPGVFREGGRDV